MNADTFLATARVAEELIAARAVADRWDEPSVLTGYTVGGLAGHLARAVFTVGRYVEEPPGTGEVTDAAGYLVRVLGTHDPVASEFHTRVRQRGAQEAGDDPGELVARLKRACDELGPTLAALDPQRPLAVLEGTVLPLREYLDTRLVELVLHLDDLALSVGRDGATGVPAEAYATVAAVLARVAVERAGPLATVRSLARRERHPGAVRAL